MANCNSSAGPNTLQKCRSLIVFHNGLRLSKLNLKKLLDRFCITKSFARFQRLCADIFQGFTRVKPHNIVLKNSEQLYDETD
jgi:hypothetical protein